MANKTIINFPCKPGETVYIGTSVAFLNEVVKGTVESIGCRVVKEGDKTFFCFRIYVDHEYIYPGENNPRHTPATRYIFSDIEIFATREQAEESLANEDCKNRKSWFDYPENGTFQMEIPYQIGDEIFICSKDLMNRPVPATVKEMRCEIQEKEGVLVFECDITVDHEYIYRKEGDRSSFPMQVNRSVFSLDELFSSIDEIKKVS